MLSSRQHTLGVLQRRIAKLERRPLEQTGTMPPPWRSGLEVLDRALPENGLAPDGLHDATGETVEDEPAAAAFVSALLRRLNRCDDRTDILLCRGPSATGHFGRFYGPGWRDWGLDPSRLLVVRTRRDRDVLWVVEEGLRCGALAAVVAAPGSIDFTSSRRLSLAAREGMTPALLLHHGGFRQASAALSRWRVGARTGTADPFDPRAPGSPRWHLDLLRCRGGRPTCCDVEWNRETGDFDLVAPLVDRPAAPVTDIFEKREAV